MFNKNKKDIEALERRLECVSKEVRILNSRLDYVIAHEHALENKFNALVKTLGISFQNVPTVTAHIIAVNKQEVV